MLQKLWDLVDGHKTDIVVGFGIAGAVLVLKGVDIPIWIILLGAAAGLAAIRDAIRKIGK